MSFRRRHDPPSWEVTDASGAVVGWVEERHLGSGAKTFYALTGVHPATGERIELQLSTDREERIQKLQDFLSDPDSCWMHFPSGGPSHRALESRLQAPPWTLHGGRSGRHG